MALVPTTPLAACVSPESPLVKVEIAALFVTVSGRGGTQHCSSGALPPRTPPQLEGRAKGGGL